jgi:hypothetical protein
LILVWSKRTAIMPQDCYWSLGQRLNMRLEVGEQKVEGATQMMMRDQSP